MHNLYSSPDIGLFSSHFICQRITVFPNSVMLLTPHWYLLFSLIEIGLADYFMQQAIKAFAEFHSIKCNILLFTYANTFHEHRVLFDFYKAVMENNNMPPALENMNNKDRKTNKFLSQRQCSRPLRSFIMGNLTFLANYMNLEKRRENTLKDVWLLFVMNDSDQELIISQIEFSIRREVYIAKPTNNGYEFWEIYKTARTDIARVIYYGNWNTYEGLKATQLSIIERRGDFGGAVFRTAQFEWEKDDSQDERRKSKLLKVVWSLLEQKLNFTTETVFIPNNSSKYQLYNTVINMTVEMLARNEIDVSMIRHWPMLSNTTLIDNSRPLFQTYSRVYIKEFESNDSWFNFFQPFAINAWYFIVSMLIVMLVAVLLMHCLGRKTGLVKTRHNFLDVCLTLHQMLCQQGGELRQELSSVSLLFVFINLWIFLIRTMYSAALTSSLAIHHYNVPFDSMDGLLKNGQYEFGVHRHSWAFSFYYKYENSFTKKLNTDMMDKNISNLPVTYLEGLKRVCSGKKYAFLANDELVFELRSKIPCRLYHLTEKVNPVNFDYATTKHNEYLPFINRWLHRFRQVGVMDKLKRDLLRIVHPTDDPEESFQSLELKDTAILSLILIGGVVLSIIILLIEIIYDKMRGYRRKC